MKRLVLAFAVLLGWSCSGGSEEGGSTGGNPPAVGAGSGSLPGGAASGPTGPGGVLAGGSAAGATQGGSAQAGAQGGGNAGGDFTECAENRADAVRGGRGSNVVWAIDTSGSMDEEAALVQQNLNRFVQAIAAAGLEDYRVVVISQRDFVSVPDPLGSDTRHFMHIEEKVGSDESLSDMLTRYDAYASFLLKGVVTHFVSVTDDESEILAQDFITQMRGRLQGEFRVHAIASPPGDMSAATTGGGGFLGGLIDDGDDDDDGGCQGAYGAAAEPGVQHFEAAKLTMGLSFSICSEDWSALFAELAKQVGETATIPCVLDLPKAPAGQTLDLGLINVVHSKAGASRGDRLPRVRGASACGNNSGWHYDDEQSPSSIVLCPSACTATAVGGSLEVAVGCQSVLF